jgi:hypothetical protein
MDSKIKIPLLVLMTLLLFVSLGSSQESRVRVVVERARIYAEASTESYRIETVKKGTVLTLFGTKKAGEDWLYVNYQSPRWGSRVTGFIQAAMVEEFAEEEMSGGVPEIQREEEAEKEQLAKPVEKPEEKPKAKHKEQLEAESQEKQIRDEEKKPEEKQAAVEAVRIDRTLEATVLPSQNVIPFPLSFVLGKKPRFYQVVTEEEAGAGVLPEGADTGVRPGDEVKTKVWERTVVIPEKTEVTEKEREIPQPPQVQGARGLEGKPLFTLGLGYGLSLGGFGGFIQLNTSGSLSVHWGFGYYPTSMFYPDYDWVRGKALYSVGIKYYLPWRSSQVRPYIDLQYGGISVEAVRVVTGIWYYTYIYEDIQKTLWGPSLMAGVELRFGSFGLNGAVGGSYVVTEWEYWDHPLFVTADIGFLLYF